MARITVEDCLKRIPNRFLLVHMAAKRVRQIREGSEYLVNSPKNEDIVVALREIAAGKVSIQQQIEEEAAPPQIEEASAPDDANEASAPEETNEDEAAAPQASDEDATSQVADEAETPEPA